MAYETPNLASVLQTLAAYAPPPSHYTTPPIAVQNPPPLEDDLSEGEYDPLDFQPTLLQPTHNTEQIAYQTHPQEQLPSRPDPDKVLHHGPSPKPTKPHQLSPAEKASSITTWSAALRYTMQLLSTSNSITPRIKHMIKSAHQHEKQWWDSRQDLLRQLAGREEGRKKLDSVLASVGGLVNRTTNDSTPADLEKELRLYDRKVHRAYSEMVAATGSELARLGIPFFGIREDLVIRASSESSAEKDSSKLDEATLKNLQVKMTAFLEEAVGE